MCFNLPNAAYPLIVSLNEEVAAGSETNFSLSRFQQQLFITNFHKPSPLLHFQQNVSDAESDLLVFHDSSTLTRYNT